MTLTAKHIECAHVCARLEVCRRPGHESYVLKDRKDAVERFLHAVLALGGALKGVRIAPGAPIGVGWV